jgi:hypothetical protein
VPFGRPLSGVSRCAAPHGRSPLRVC